MLISEAIEQLETLYKAHGDLEVIGMIELDDCFALDYGREFEVMGIPCDHCGEEHQACVFISLHDETSEEPETHLKLVHNASKGATPVQ
jgi:uncharacterized protein YuzE